MSDEILEGQVAESTSESKSKLKPFKLTKPTVSVQLLTDASAETADSDCEVSMVSTTGMVAFGSRVSVVPFKIPNQRAVVTSKTKIKYKRKCDLS